ncbi:MAG: replicative DNA helicase [Candidatus Eisenbacteria bacterium]|nr:replicative DNA helicase [Candidatus Eisenbacteria bacterium]
MAQRAQDSKAEEKLRSSPHSEDAERSVLGSMLLDEEAIPRCIEILEESDFHFDRHRKLFKAIVQLYMNNRPADAVTLAEELARMEALEEVGGRSYISSLLDYVATSGNVEFHSKIIVEKSTLRKLINAAGQISKEAFDAVDDSASILDRAEASIFRISDARTRGGFVPMKEILKHSFEAIQELYDRKRHFTGVTTGFAELDNLTSGFQKSDLIVIAGRPTMGKTSFGLNVAANVAIEHKLPVAVFSLEMSKEQLVQRMLCSQARVDAHRLRTGYLKDSEWPALTTAAGRLSEAPIYIDDSPSLSILEMRAKARRLRKETELALIVIDYLQLVRGLPGAENRQQEISQISRSLKALAKELEVPVIAISQLSRAPEKRGDDRRPVLSDLRESGAIEQDADVVIFIFRPEVYDKNDETRGIAELIIGKQRNGPSGTVEVVFISEYTRFENLSRVPEEPHPSGL